jgi:cyclophilin family peptidyl-prolyl cis-trans isomerase
MLSPLVLASPKAVISTSLGEMTFELDDKTAPQTTAQFIRLANSGWYDGKAFYRVVQGHVVQAGINDDSHPDHTTYQVDGEFSEDKPQIRGSLGLARGEDPNSGSTEFYICLERRAHLDGQYTNFGHLIAGEAVLDQIAAVKVKQIWLDNTGGTPIAFHQPETPVVIQSIKILP